MAKPFVRQVFELRYEPLVQFFDRRSELLGRIFKDSKTKQPNFQHWQLRDSRVDFVDADQMRMFIVTYRNCGYQCDDPPSENYAKDQILKYVTAASEVIGEDFEVIQRIGFREIQVFPVEDLQPIKKLLKENFIQTDTPFFRALNANLDDFTVLPLVFRKGDHSFQITLGPASKDDIAMRVGNVADMPDAALYADIDYYSIGPQLKPGFRTTIADFLNRSHDTVTTIREQLTQMRLV